ncbi:MAG: hypothetical protein KatS3mg057_1380 [Herpetosiphonaceae bacterium]|nr:MAG: hypothetical protein KatS3mg057_1380 [Herpetosiphonaceae bacterium]
MHGATPATADKRYTLFADESGTHAKSKCYGIGALVLTDQQLKELSAFIDAEKKLRRFTGELKWNEIRNYRISIEIAKNVISYVLERRLIFHIIVVQKSLYNNWGLDKERAFYVTYYQLIRSISKKLESEDFQVYIDDRSDSYDKQHEVLEITLNYTLRNEAPGRVVTVTKIDSVPSLALQVADILTGTVTSSTNCYLDPQESLRYGKAELVNHFSGLLGWDALHYDTFPDSMPINIWHFPEDFRGKPATKPIQLRI